MNIKESVTTHDHHEDGCEVCDRDQEEQRHIISSEMLANLTFVIRDSRDTGISLNRLAQAIYQGLKKGDAEGLIKSLQEFELAEKKLSENDRELPF